MRTTRSCSTRRFRSARNNHSRDFLRQRRPPCDKLHRLCSQSGGVAMRNRLRRFVVGGAVAALAGGTMIATTALSGPASAAPVTFNTACQATVTGGLNLTLTVHQDVTLEASAPE